MSPSMWAWRVVVPALGLVVCSLVFWRSYGPVSTSPNPPRSIGAPSVEDRVIAEGRVAAIPGAEVTVGAEVSAPVVRLAVREKSKVARGDVLVELRTDDAQAVVIEAEARLSESEAEVSFWTRKAQVYNKAPSSGLLFQIELEEIRRELDVNLARRRGAIVARDRAKLALGRLKIVSPIDGVVIDCRVRVGEIAGIGLPLVTICDLTRLRVEAEVDEFDINRIATGDDVRIKAEGFGPTTWAGTVEEIPDRVGGRTLRPEDPGRPSDTRVLLVKIALNEPIPLKLGQQVEVEIRRKHP